MKLFIVRHGETVENAGGIIQGWKPGNLSRKGKEQAKRLARRLGKENFDIIYCSDLRRCKQTVEPLLKIKKTPIVYAKELRERSQGRFDGKSREVFREWLASQNLPADVNKKWNIIVPGGESFKQVRKRTKKILDKIMKKHNGRKVLIVTHGQAKISIMLNLFKRDEERHYKKYRSHNTGLSVINVKDDGNHRARMINSIKHLDK